MRRRILSSPTVTPSRPHALEDSVVAMDESQFPPYFGDGSSKTQRRPPPPVSSAPVAGGLPSLTFPGTLTLPTARGALTLFCRQPIMATTHHHQWIPPASLSIRRRLYLLNPLQPNIPATLQWDDPSIQPDWDDLVSSFQPAAARTPSTGLSAGDLPNDSYDIDLLMANISDEYSSSVFSSAPPSSIPEDDDWSSRGWSSSGSRPVSAAPSSAYSDARGDRPVIFTHFFGVSCLLSLPSPPFVSVEIEQWDGTNWATTDLPCIEADVPLADEAPNMDARLGWDFKPSNVKWLDPDVSSEVAEFPQGTRLTEKNKIYAFHRVTGCPSQFPFFRQHTSFLINLTDVKGWWEHKLMHRWLLRGIIQCLLNIPLERWNTMEATTNLGEAQHAWNNAQTGISMGVIESFKKYEELDI
ncbi:hypothetical protein B0H14DRAFT_3877466 [Mycena olivaceomarginata]|nr:hypothetical protein B0H14DRAFT_3877466 [Mycena olivaceomarginata]